MKQFNQFSIFYALPVAAILLVLSSLATAKLVDVTEEAIFDISIGGKQAGTIVIALFGRDLPRTVANFATFASINGFQSPNNNNNYNYKNSRFHRVIPNFVIQVSTIIFKKIFNFVNLLIYL